MPYLEIVEGSPMDPFVLEQPELVLGRSQTCDLVLPGKAVSRHHARLSMQGDSLFIEDMASRYGTYLNGLRITKPTKLLDRDLIKIGENALRFHQGELRTSGPPSEAGDGKSMILSTYDATVEPDQSMRVDPGLKLHAVMEILRCLRSTLQADDLLPKILESLFRIFPQAEAGVIFLLDGKNGGADLASRLTLKASKTRSGVDDTRVGISQTILQQALDKKQAILSADAQSDDLFKESFSVSTYNIRSLMCVPLLSQSNEPFGVLQIYAGETGRLFSEDDLDILASVASTTALALENLRLHEGLLAKEKMQRELQLARDMQQRFLPARLPDIPGYPFFASYQSALSVGGDYYGFIELPDGRLAIALGDVSGKGMPAAMVMARLSSDIRYAAITHSDPGAALAVANRSLCEADLEGKFVTLILIFLDPASHTMTIANAGHLPALLRRADGEVVEIGKNAAGFPLSIDPDSEYPQFTCALNPGDLIWLYTDGVIEAMNPSGRLFGIDRLREALGSEAGLDLPSIGTRVFEAVTRFADGRPQNDDISVVCFRRES